VLSPDDPRRLHRPGHLRGHPWARRGGSRSCRRREAEKRIQQLEREYAEKSAKIHVIHQLLKAYALYSKDEQYVVEDGQIIIVDEFTGRKMQGGAGPTACTRRWRPRRT
jgi:hypothetical protein